MIGPSSEQLFGPFDAGRNEGAGDIPSLFQQLADAFKAGRDVGGHDVERSPCRIEGTLVRMTNVGRSKHNSAFGDVGGRLIGLSGYVTSDVGLTTRCLRGLSCAAPRRSTHLRHLGWCLVGVVGQSGPRRSHRAGHPAYTLSGSPPERGSALRVQDRINQPAQKAQVLEQLDSLLRSNLIICFLPKSMSGVGGGRDGNHQGQGSQTWVFSDSEKNPTTDLDNPVHSDQSQGVFRNEGRVGHRGLSTRCDRFGLPVGVSDGIPAFSNEDRCQKRAGNSARDGHQLLIPVSPTT